MQSFYGFIQGSTCHGQQAQTEKEEEFQDLWKNNKELNALIEKKIKQEKDEDRKRASALSGNVDF